MTNQIKNSKKSSESSNQKINEKTIKTVEDELKKENKMFWADSLAKEMLEKYPEVHHIVSDAKTPSGKIHVGALRGVILHDVVYRALIDAGGNATFLYRFDDFDPMDSISEELSEKFSKYMGMPLCDIPSPVSGFDNYAQAYADEFINSFEKLGNKPKIVSTALDYRAGKFNDLIRTACEKSDIVIEINRRISGAKKETGWLPIHVLCESCGRIGTTFAHDFDGKTVAYTCTGAKYSKGCGFSGRRSPFNGGSKLTWKIHWAAQFKVYNVTMEGGGKDHYTVGGSREVADAASVELFNYTPPYDMAYEFFLVGGKKMSSSKGVGSSTREITDMLSPQILRFLIVRYKPRTAINFSPFGDTIPKLYDDYENFAESYFGRKQARDPDEPRIFALSQVNEIQKPIDRWRPSFSLVAYLTQVPHVNLLQAMENAKGAKLTELEKEDLNETERATKVWLANYADPADKISILPQSEGVGKFLDLTKGQQNALAEFADFFADNFDQNKQAEMARQITLKNQITIKDFFQGAYTVLVGRKEGPRLLPFLATLNRQFIVQRLKGVQ